MIELEQLKQLIAFATYGTLSKAAEELYFHSLSLSRLIQKLVKIPKKYSYLKKLYFRDSPILLFSSIKPFYYFHIIMI